MAKDLTAKEVVAFAQDKDKRRRARAARHPSLPKKYMEILAKDSKVEVVASLAENKQLPKKIVKELFKHSEFNTNDKLCYNLLHNYFEVLIDEFDDFDFSQSYANHIRWAIKDVMFVDVSKKNMANKKDKYKNLIRKVWFSFPQEYEYHYHYNIVYKCLTYGFEDLIDEVIESDNYKLKEILAHSFNYYDNKYKIKIDSYVLKLLSQEDANINTHILNNYYYHGVMPREAYNIFSKNSDLKEKIFSHGIRFEDDFVPEVASEISDAKSKLRFVCKNYDSLKGNPDFVLNIISESLFFVLGELSKSEGKDKSYQNEYSDLTNIATNHLRANDLPDDILLQMLDVFENMHVREYCYGGANDLYLELLKKKELSNTVIEKLTEVNWDFFLESFIKSNHFDKCYLEKIEDTVASFDNVLGVKSVSDALRQKGIESEKIKKLESTVESKQKQNWALEFLSYYFDKEELKELSEAIISKLNSNEELGKYNHLRNQFAGFMNAPLFLCR